MVTMTLKDRISFGNTQLRIYDVTNASSAGSTITEHCDRVYAVKAINNTDSSDTFKESVGADSSSTTKNQFTLTPVTNNDGGHCWVWVR